MHALIRNALADAEREELVHRNVAKLVRPPRARREEVRVLTVEDARVGRLPGETSCLALVWAVLDRASRGRRGLTMTSDGLRLLQDLRRCLLDPPRQLRPQPAAAERGDQPGTVTAAA